MNIKLLRALWILIIVLFIALEIYHGINGNYRDLITSLLTVIILLLLIGAFFIIKKK